MSKTMIKGIREAAVAWGKAWSRYECGTLAAATAYYAALSMVPLMLVIMAGVGAFFKFADHAEDARQKLLEVVSMQVSPAFSEAIDKLLSSLGESAATNGPLAGLGLLVSASLVFVQIDRGFGRIWEVRDRPQEGGVAGAARRFAMLRLRSLVLVVLGIVLLLLLFLAGLAVRGSTELLHKYFPEIETLSFGGTLMIGLGLNVVTFLTIYKVLSKEKVGTMLCLKAAVFAALLWEVGSRVLMKLSFGEHYGAYGHVGSLLVMQVWIYYTAVVLFAGALVVRNAGKASGETDAEAG